MDVRRAAFVGVALLIAGCVNLEGANLSNIGNGNSANISGNNLSGSVNVPGQGSTNPTMNPGNGGGVYNPGRLTEVTLNRSGYRLHKLPGDLNLDTLRYYSSQNLLTDQDRYMNGGPSPSPDNAPFFGNLEEIRFHAEAKREFGQMDDVDPVNNGEWILELPAGVRLINPQTPEPFMGQFPRFLLASSEAATGSYVLTIRSKSEPSVIATASVEIDDLGAADVEIN